MAAFEFERPPLSLGAVIAYLSRLVDQIAQAFSQALPQSLEMQGTSTADIANLEATITWDSANVAGEIDGVDVYTDRLEATQPVNLKVTVNLMQEGNNRTELQIRQYRDAAGAGSYTEDTAKRFGSYTSRDTDQAKGGVSCTFRVELDAGDKLQYRAFCNADGTSVLETDGTTIIAQEVA